MKYDVYSFSTNVSFGTKPVMAWLFDGFAFWEKLSEISKNLQFVLSNTSFDYENFRNESICDQINYKLIFDVFLQ